MKSILVDVKNTLLMQAIQLALLKSNDFKVAIEGNSSQDDLIGKLKKEQYDILFMDIARSYPYNYEEREKLIYKIRRQKIDIKIAVFCDSNSEINVASKVKELKALNLIDVFFYETVDDKYMVAVLETL